MTVVQGFGPGDTDHEDAGEEAYEAEAETEVEAEELSLVEEDESLPWLESDYDEEEGVDTGRLIGFILLSLVILGLILAAAWWFLRDRPDPELVEQGGTIEASEGAVKERPDDPGGKEFEGTGNVAPTVGQGVSTEGRLAEDGTPRPSIDTEQGAGSSVAVQVGAFSSRASAGTAWQTLRGQTQALNGFRNRIVEGEVDGGKVFRLQALADDVAAANSLCNALKADGIACQVKR